MIIFVSVFVTFIASVFQEYQVLLLRWTSDDFFEIGLIDPQGIGFVEPEVKGLIVVVIVYILLHPQQ